MELILFIQLDKDSPSTAKSSRRDSLNDRVMMNAQNFEVEPIQSNHLPNVPIQSPPIHMMQQHVQDKQDLPVRSNK